jgi:hypothetical protein
MSTLNELITENAWFERILDKHGICTDCGEFFEHHYDEPFASCGCGTSEWSARMTEHQQLKKLVKEM